MNTAKWVTGAIGVVTFIFASFFSGRLGWGDVVLAVPAIFLAICLVLILVDLFGKNKHRLN